MTRKQGKLTDTVFRNAKPKASAYKIYDEGGLRMLVRPTGTKVWQFPYSYDGKANIYTIGQYPSILPAEARSKMQEIKKLLAEGKNPNIEKFVTKRRALMAATDGSFEVIAREWHAKQVWVPRGMLRHQMAPRLVW